jgi:hypothetical protein
MSTPERKDPVTTAENLGASIDGMSAELGRLRKYGRHNRWFVVVDVVLTVVLALTGGLAVHSAQVASQASKAQLALCQAGNVARAQQIVLWDHLLSVAKAPPHETAAQREQRLKTVGAFRAYVHRVFRSRDCSKLGQPGGPATGGSTHRG